MKAYFFSAVALGNNVNLLDLTNEDLTLKYRERNRYILYIYISSNLPCKLIGSYITMSYIKAADILIPLPLLLQITFLTCILFFSRTVSWEPRIYP